MYFNIFREASGVSLLAKPIPVTDESSNSNNGACTCSCLQPSISNNPITNNL
jgi:hypothetical protein